MEGFAATLARGPVGDVARVLRVAEAVAAAHQGFLQLIDADAVFNLRHLRSAFLHATRSMREGRATAKTLGAEFLRYLTGERQVARALEKSGLREATSRIVVVAAGPASGAAVKEVLERLHWTREAAGVEENRRAIERLGIRPSGTGDLEDDVLERVALVDVSK